MNQQRFVRGYAFLGVLGVLVVLLLAVWPQPVGVTGQISPIPTKEKRVYTLYYPVVPLGSITSRSSSQPTSTPAVAPRPTIARTRTFYPTPIVTLTKEPPPIVAPRTPVASAPQQTARRP